MHAIFNRNPEQIRCMQSRRSKRGQKIKGKSRRPGRKNLAQRGRQGGTSALNCMHAQKRMMRFSAENRPPRFLRGVDGEGVAGGLPASPPCAAVKAALGDSWRRACGAADLPSPVSSGKQGRSRAAAALPGCGCGCPAVGACLAGPSSQAPEARGGAVAAAGAEA